MRQITKKTQLYTEMIVDQTILHQQDNLDYFLGHDDVENRTVLQIGGNDPKQLAETAKICSNYGGFSEINLNVGCPSPKVSKNCFGARLMLDPENVRDITYSMIKAVPTNLPITVKCRLGVDDFDSYEYLKNFVSVVQQSGVDNFIVHARKCILNGLSAHQNRTIPPLKYDYVHRLCKDFPNIAFSLNGGVKSFDDVQSILDDGEKNLEGVMIGRMAYNYPWTFRNADSKFFKTKDPGLSRREIVEKYLDYCDDMQTKYGKTRVKNGKHGLPNSVLIKPLLAIFAGERGGKAFKRYISDSVNRHGKDYDIGDVINSAIHQCVPEEVLDERVLESID